MKTPKKRVLPALLLSLFAGFAAPTASAATFSNVYVFGDSLSDAGYFRPFFQGLTAQGLPPSLVPILGRFTTSPGPTWAELVAQFYGVTPNPSNVDGGTIFAQGGARVASIPGFVTPPGQPQRPVSTQIDEFLAANGGSADPAALYTVWAGANDLFFQLGALQAGAIDAATLQAQVLGAAGAEIAQIRRLRDAGAQYIAVFGLPNVGLTPAFAGTPNSQSVTLLSAGYNTTLYTGLQAAGIKVIPVDTFALFNQILANPTAFGFSNITTPACGPFPPFSSSANSFFCLSSNLVAPGADQNFVFADSVHPTTAAHRVIAQFVESLIEGPSQYGLMAESAVRMRAGHVRTIADGAAKGRQEEVGRFGVFAGADSTDFDIESGTGLTGVGTRMRSGTLGITMRASESVTLGLAYGNSRSRATFGLNAGNFYLKEEAWSVFGHVRWGGFYGTAVLSLADLALGDIHRNVVLGANHITTSAGAEGNNSSAYIAAGYDFPIGRLLVGPTVSMLSQNVDINAFDESGGGAAGLRIRQQKRKSEIWSVGARASLDLGNWTPWVRVTADKERRDDVRNVSATPLSMLAINPVYDVPTYRPDTSYMTGAIGVNGLIVRNVALSLAYFKVSGRSGTTEDGVSGMVSIRF
ncbi:MAG TPA: autotransporter domain-containing protein [Usitatibacter sp.]|nr:autotransporter domain-containing protein [Usitatibacter sp.]